MLIDVQKKPDYLIFADGAKQEELTEFPDINRGWGATIELTASKPPMEWFNGAFNRVDRHLLYLLQQGVPDWNDKVTYPVNAVIKYNGILYIATNENNNAKPSTNTTKWKKLLDEASLTKKGIVQLNSAVNSESESEAATPKAVKATYDKALNAESIASTAQATADIAKIDAENAHSKANNASNTADAAKLVAEKDATTENKGRVRLSSAINSDSEAFAATSLAIKKVYDLASKATAKAYIIETYKSDDGSSWYRKWSDGFIEQGIVKTGTFNMSTVHNLIKPFSNANYTIILNARYTSYSVSIGPIEKTTTTFTSEASRGVGGNHTYTTLTIYACGY